MSTGVYIGVGGKAKKVTGIYIGVGGVARKVTKGYIGVGGKAQLFWTAATKTPTLLKDVSSSTLANGSTYNAYSNRGTVFNNRAIFNDRSGTSTANCKIATMTTSLTKTSLTSTQTYLAVTQCARLSSYAIAGGAYSNSYNGAVSINSSFTVASLISRRRTTANGGYGGAGSQTSSYAIFISTCGYSSGESNTSKGLAYNNSLTQTIISGCPSYKGYSTGCAESLGDTVAFLAYSTSASDNSACTINNSLTVTLMTNGDMTANGSSYYASTSKPYMCKVPNGNNIYIGYRRNTSPYFCVAGLRPTLTSSMIYTDDAGLRSSNTAQGVAAGATQNFAIFAGGGTSAGRTKLIDVFNATGTKQDVDLKLSAVKYNCQSSVHPLYNSSTDEYYLFIAGGYDYSTYQTAIEYIKEYYV